MAKAAKPGAPAPWLDEMRARIGIQEIPGRRHNPLIVSWFHDIGHAEVNDDETSWCAVTVGSCLKHVGYPTTPVQVNMLARSYLTYGVKCAPKPGALAVWPRGKSQWQGHVNLVEDVRQDQDGRIKVRCVGGNQGGLAGGDAVTRSAWRAADEALGFRWPVAASVTALRKAGSSEIRKADQVEMTAAVTAGVGVAGAVAQAATQQPDIIAPALMPTAVEQISFVQQILEGLNGLARAFGQSPWLGVVVVVCIAGVILARTWKKSRVVRHLLGLPIAAEAQGGNNAD